jgi:hypothetical protein
LPPTGSALPDTRLPAGSLHADGETQCVVGTPEGRQRLHDPAGATVTAAAIEARNTIDWR